MVSKRTKKVKEKEYVYAEHSFRIPRVGVKKVSKLLQGKKLDDKEIKEYFLKKEIEAYVQAALKSIKTNSVLTKEKITKIESIRVNFKHLLKGLTKLQMKEVIDRFTVNFTYESNAIEGSSLTLKDVTLILHENIVPKGKDFREVYETRNTREVNELLFQRKWKLNLANVLKVHRMLMRETGVYPGFKRVPNFILGKNLKTVPPEKVEAEIIKLLGWYHASKKHPISIAAEFHGRFEKIHPFEDGNGRVGRVLINAILFENGYPPLIIRKTMRLSYFSALEAFDSGYKHKLERFLIKRFEATFEKFYNIYVKYL